MSFLLVDQIDLHDCKDLGSGDMMALVIVGNCRQQIPSDGFPLVQSPAGLLAPEVVSVSVFGLPAWQPCFAGRRVRLVLSVQHQVGTLHLVERTSEYWIKRQVGIVALAHPGYVEKTGSLQKPPQSLGHME